MKKYTFSILALILLFVQPGMAKPVSLQTAKQVAQNYFRHAAKVTSFAPTVAVLAYTEQAPDKSPLYYVFNLNTAEGFIIVSGDDAATPVLGYSKTASFDPQEVNSSFTYWMEGLKREIEYARTHSLKADNVTADQWDRFVSNRFDASSAAAGVDALVTVAWGQDPFENKACPLDSKENVNCVTGCPATAMAQIMKYWNYPAQGHGSHSYNHPDYGTLSANFGNSTYAWDQMPDLLTEDNEFVAKLMSDCGIAVNMQYSPFSSGAYILEESPTPKACSQYAYKRYFGYSSEISGIWKIDYEDDEWKELLKNELNNGRPMQYAGYGGGGHTFVCDGYDDNDLFHMNWGWSGTLNGFYALNALSPGSGGTGSGEGTYNQNQQAIIGIQPSGSLTSGRPIFGLKLNKAVEISTQFVETTLPFSVKADISYLGSSDFKGDVAALLFDDEGVFVDYVDILTDQDFKSGQVNTVTFQSEGISAIPGYHTLGIYSSMPNDSLWNLINKVTFANPIPLKVYGPPNNIKINDTTKVAPSKVILTEPFSITTSIINTDTVGYTGSFLIDLFDSEGDFVKTISQVDGIQIAAGQSREGIVFNIPGLNVIPGTYYATIFESQDSANFYFVSDDFYANPIKFDISEAPLVADIFENNNTDSTAFELPLTFTNSLAMVNTAGSNLHYGEDIDHYKLTLPPGYDYEINARVTDQYTPGVDTYTCDITFNYNTGSGSSIDYDDSLTAPVMLKNGGKIDFKIAPFFIGMTGTYLLELEVRRSITTAVRNLPSENYFKVYPVPSASVITLEAKNPQVKFDQVKMYNNLGQVVKMYSGTSTTEKSVQLNVSNLTDGIYTLQVKSGNKQLTRKIVVHH